MLEAYTDGRFNLSWLTGPGNRNFRAELMAVLVGHKVPAAKCGINALAEEFHRQAQIVGDCSAQRDDNFAEFCKRARAFSGVRILV